MVRILSTLVIITVLRANVGESFVPSTTIQRRVTTTITTAPWSSSSSSSSSSLGAAPTMFIY